MIMIIKNSFKKKNFIIALSNLSGKAFDDKYYVWDKYKNTSYYKNRKNVKMMMFDVGVQIWPIPSNIRVASVNYSSGEVAIQ